MRHFTKIHNFNTPLDARNGIKKKTNHLEDSYVDFVEDYVDREEEDVRRKEERSLSKLELTKTYSRSTVTRDASLATLSMENAIVQNLHFSDLIEIFAAKRKRKVNFY